MAYSKYNYGSNAISGAGAGASAGAAFGPWGAAIGGGLGLVAGLFQSAAEEENAKERKRILDEAAQALDVSYNDIEQSFRNYFDTYNDAFKRLNSSGGSSYDIRAKAASEAADAIMNYGDTVTQRLEEAGLASPEDYKFNYKNADGSDITVEDFLNPYMDDVIDYSNRKVTASAAGAGLGRSTGAAQAISQNTARQYNDLYNTALNAYNTDRSQRYQEWSGYINNMNNRLNMLLNADQFQINQQLGLGKDYGETLASEAETLANMKQNKANTKTQISLSEAASI